MTLLDIADRLRATGYPRLAAQVEALGLDLAIEAPVVAVLAALVAEIVALRRRLERIEGRWRA